MNQSARKPGAYVAGLQLGSWVDFLRVLLLDESGQDLIEYALVAALLGLAAVASMKTLGSKIAQAFTTVSSGVTSNI